VKKLNFGLILIISGTLLISSVLIASAIMNIGSYDYLLGTQEINTLFTFSLIIFLGGLVISAIEVFKQPKQ